mmetsp:Transcript_82543/g.198076  ORF Transcript_82543/g.198076 Transcript_82543/m.198076 type:complete len:122 (-) Transcript_82543:490-855(-)
MCLAALQLLLATILYGSGALQLHTAAIPACSNGAVPKGRWEAAGKWSLQFGRAKLPQSTSSVAFCFLELAELASEASAAFERPRFSDAERCNRNAQVAQCPQGQMLQADCKDANPHCACEN